MQALSVFSVSPSFNSKDSVNDFEAEYAQLSANFSSQLQIAGSGGDFEFEDAEKPEMEDKEAQSVDDGGECESENEDDFSFAPTNADGSPISADDIFQNGQIRPVFLIFNRDLLFAEADNCDASRTRATSYATSSWSLKTPLKEALLRIDGHAVIVGVRVG